MYANVSSVFTAAVDDGLIPKNPCKAPSVRRPKSDPRKLKPWTRKQAMAVRDHLPDQFKLVVDLGIGLGLRQGEIFGLSLDDIDLNTGEIEIKRQVKLLGSNRQLFGLPKGRKIRTVPIPDRVLELINDHVTRYPPRSVTLPWDKSDGPERTFDLILYSRESRALNRNYFNPKIWRPALRAAGLEAKRENGCHALRHLYASTLLDAGESILALSEYLGHADPGFTLRTYTHLMPSSTERTKAAIDAMLSVPSAPHEPSQELFPQVSALRYSLQGQGGQVALPPQGGQRPGHRHRRGLREQERGTERHRVDQEERPGRAGRRDRGLTPTSHRPPPRGPGRCG